MAIRSKKFEVIFTQKRGEYINQIEVEHFFTTEEDFYEKREDIITEIKENIDLAITFRSHRGDSRLFMDGFDTLPKGTLEMDFLTGEVYLSPSENPVILFDNAQEYYPLIPGLYRMAVDDEGQRYFSWIKVIPKQLEEVQWEVMRTEVEKELKGLAQDSIMRKSGLKNRMDALPHGLLEQFIVINNRFPSVMAAINDLYRKVNFRIRKDYLLVPKEKSRLIDEKTLKHRVSHPENDDVLMTPISAITYDLPENRLAKKIIQSISNRLTGFIDVLENMEKGIRSSEGMSAFRTAAEKNKMLEEVDKLGEIARKMRGAIHWLKTAPWYEAVGTFQSTVLPPIMTSDPRYRALYQLDRELNNEQALLQVHQTYSHQWKRTDKLYEIWGYLQFIKTLAGDELGFSPIKGWLYNEDFSGGSLLVPTLPAGTEVVFQKDDVRIHLVYEAMIPTQSRLTTSENPLYTRGTHTCPDGRMDVYLDEIFIGTIIFDFKYRPKHSIWNQNLLNKNQQNGVMRQLVSYGDNLHSPYLFNQGSNPYFQYISPVQEVWAIYPNRYGTSKNQEYPDHKVSLIELTPGQDNRDFAGKMKLSIDTLVVRSKVVMEVLDKMGAR